MVLKRTPMNNLKEYAVSFCNPKTGEMIHPDGAVQHFSINKKTGLTPLTLFLNACTSPRLFTVGELTDTSREWYEVERNSTWLSDGIFSERSYTMRNEATNARIQVRFTGKSFFPSCTNVHVAYEAYKKLSSIYKEHAHMPLLTSPSQTGLYLFESTLPYGIELTPLDDGYERLIREYTTQPRVEVMTPSTRKTITDFYYSDGRWMYAACFDKEMPIGTPIHDSIPVYEKYSCGWYNVTVTIPSTWQHIGLVPQKTTRAKSTHWIWNNTPDAKITTWVAEPELRVAIEQGWNVKVLERLLFPHSRVFRTMHKELVTMWNEAALIADGTVRKQVQKGVSSIMLSTIGRLYSTSWQREQKVTIEEYRKIYASLPASVRLNAIRSGDVMILPKRDALTDKDKKYYHPYLSSYIWSYCRALLAKNMLQLPYESILGCRTDAIYTTIKPPFEDTGKIGQFRLKGELHGVFPAPSTLDDLHTLSVQSEYSENPKA